MVSMNMSVQKLNSSYFNTSQLRATNTSFDVWMILALDFSEMYVPFVEMAKRFMWIVFGVYDCLLII